MYERHTEPLLPRRQFLRRLARHGEIAMAVLLVSLALGTLGFHWLAPQGWLDAFLNAAMLLGGMGPVGSFEQPDWKGVRGAICPVRRHRVSWRRGGFAGAHSAPDTAQAASGGARQGKWIEDQTSTQGNVRRYKK